MSRARDTADQINRVNSSAADATAITVDSSENVLIGMTTASTNNDGAGIRSDGLIHAKRADVVATFNRKTSDGNIVELAKDNTVVGSIGTYNDYMTVGSGDTGLLIYNGGDVIRPHNMSNNTARDNAIDLGSTSDRFKDLYLSGGVYLGGTGSANYLDDFEKGTWTPALQNAPGGISHVGGTTHDKYTKVGNLVTISGHIELNTGSSSSNPFLVNGLPFTANSTTAVAGSMIARYGSTDTYMPYIANASRLEWYKVNNTGNWNLMTYADLNGAFSVHFSISYTA